MVKFLNYQSNELVMIITFPRIIYKVLLYIGIFTLIPIIMYFLNKRFCKGFPVTKEISQALDKVEKNKELKRLIERYSKISLNISILTWAILGTLAFIGIGNIITSKYGDNSFRFFAPFFLLLSSMIPILALGNYIATKVFKIMNPKIESKLFDVYSAYYAPRGFGYSKSVNAIELNKKLVFYSYVVFVPSLILSILFAII